MTILTRFGRKLAIPSTRQIRHELLVFGVQEEARLKDVERKKAEGDAAGPGAVLPAAQPPL